MPLKRISTQAINKAFELNMLDANCHYRIGWTQLDGRKNIAAEQLKANQRKYDKLEDEAANSIKALTELTQRKLGEQDKAHNAVVREKDIEIMRLKEEMQMHEKTL